jgi:tetratricopeptide (TPR) repeat protein
VKNKPSLPAIAITTIAAFLLLSGSASAQNNSDKELADQLKQQYKLSDTVLIVQKDGILAVPPSQAVAGESTFKEGALHPPGVGQRLVLGTDTRNFPVTDKVHVLELTASVKKDKVVLLLGECAACNGNELEYRAFVAFQFPKGYLASADAGQIEDVISQVLTIDAGNAQPEQTAAPPAESQASGPPALTNDDVVKMVQAQLPDSVIIAKIKSSSCAFDTSPDALISLKKSGVSAAVLQAMAEAPGPPPAQQDNAGSPTAPPPPCNDYNSCISGGTEALSASRWDDAIAAFQQATNLDATRADAWAELGSAFLADGRTQDSPAMWDKALKLGGPLTFAACHRESFKPCVPGKLTLGAKEISFTSSDGQKLFAVPPADVSPINVFKGQSAVLGGSASNEVTMHYVDLTLKISGKNYRFEFVPSGVKCHTTNIMLCPDEGITQQTVLANYVLRTIPRLASGQPG